MLLLTLAVALAPFQPAQEDISRALRVFQALGVVRKGEQPKITREESLSREPIYNMVGYSAAFRLNGSLSYFRWNDSRSARRERKVTWPTVTDAKVLSEAKRYVSKLWPKQRFQFQNPNPGSDPELPTKEVGFCPIVKGILTDEAYMGFIEIDIVGGEVEKIYGPKIPLAPPSLRSKLKLEDVETQMISKMAAKRITDFARPWSPCALRIGPEDKPEHGKPGRLSYRFFADSFSMQSPEKAGYYGSLIIRRIDATTGMPIEEGEAGIGGRVPFQLPFPKLTDEKYRALVTGTGARVNLEDGAVTEMKPATPRGGLRSVAMIGKRIVSFAFFDPQTLQLYFSCGGYFEGTPDAELKKAISKLAKAER